jgi:hypothetical protein
VQSFTGYTTVLAFFGHAVAESNLDLQALIASAEGFAGPGIIVPTRNSDLFRWCLENGLRVVQPMTLMTLGLYNEPAGGVSAFRTLLKRSPHRPPGECAQWIAVTKCTRWVCVRPASRGPATVRVGKRASAPTNERTILIFPYPRRIRSSEQGNIPRPDTKRHCDFLPQGSSVLFPLASGVYQSQDSAKPTSRRLALPTASSSS